MAYKGPSKKYSEVFDACVHHCMQNRIAVTFQSYKRGKYESFITGYSPESSAPYRDHAGNWQSKIFIDYSLVSLFENRERFQFTVSKEETKEVSMSFDIKKVGHPLNVEEMRKYEGKKGWFADNLRALERSVKRDTSTSGMRIRESYVLDDYPYLSPSAKYRYFYPDFYPAETKIIVKPAMDILKELLKEGYMPDENGDWRINEGYSTLLFTATMWQFCGKTPPEGRFTWRSNWLKEVEA